MAGLTSKKPTGQGGGVIDGSPRGGGHGSVQREIQGRWRMPVGLGGGGGGDEGRTWGPPQPAGRDGVSTASNSPRPGRCPSTPWCNRLPLKGQENEDNTAATGLLQAAGRQHTKQGSRCAPACASPKGLSRKPMYSADMMGKSSMRTMWVSPMLYHSTKSASLTLRFFLVQSARPSFWLGSAAAAAAGAQARGWGEHQHQSPRARCPGPGWALQHSAGEAQSGGRAGWWVEGDWERVWLRGWGWESADSPTAVSRPASGPRQGWPAGAGASPQPRQEAGFGARGSQQAPFASGGTPSCAQLYPAAPSRCTQLYPTASSRCTQLRGAHLGAGGSPRRGASPSRCRA